MGNIISLLIAGGAFATDRITKQIADRKLSDGREVTLKRCGFIRFRKSENTGFAGSRLSGHRTLVVALSTMVFAVCLVMYAAILSGSAGRSVKAGIGLMLGGAAGNVFDRLTKGRVTDFIIAKPVKSIIFNVADVFILTGAIVTALCGLLINGDNG